MSPLPKEERAAKTRRQLEQVDEQLTREFPEIPENVVHREVAEVSTELLAGANFSDHVAVLTGRIAAEHLRATEGGTETRP